MIRGSIILVGLVAFAWVLEIGDAIVPGHWLDDHGIRPHTLAGLWGILFSPFLHAGFAHLAANTVPFLILGFLVMLRGLGTFVGVSLLVMLVGGLGVWLFGSANTDVIGASGVIFGYIGYLLGRGYFERGILSIAVAVVVGVMFGGALWGILPGDPHISWQAHLFGFIAGFGVAWAGLSKSPDAAPASTAGLR
jgi:membrane associated rhomboid family serine protease